MYKSILVPLDGSERAEVILPHVIHLATQNTSEIILLQVIEIPHLTNLPRLNSESYEGLPQLNQNQVNQLVQEANNYLEQQVDAIENNSIKAQSRILHGPIAVTIIKAAEETNADLIAMASHGSSGIEGVYYGSVAAGVLQRVDRPLLIVRSK